MIKKKLKFHVYQMKKETSKGSFATYSENEIESIFSSIKSHPFNIDNKSASRYSNPGSNDEKCLIFDDEITGVDIPKHDFLSTFLFIHRRGNTRPLQENGEGEIVELQLENEKFQIAEVSFILLDRKYGYILSNYNPFVGGITKFNEYLNSKNIDFEDHSGKKFHSIVLSHVINPNSYDDFINKMKVVKQLEFNITGTAEYLSQMFLFGTNHGKGMEMVRHFAENSNTAKLKIELSAEKNKKKIPIDNSLNKKFIVDIFEDVKEQLDSGKDNKFTVVGKIDHDLKVIDLIESKLIYELRISYEPPTMPIGEVLTELQKLLIIRRGEIVNITEK